MFFYILIALVVVVDQWVKYYIRTHMSMGESIPLIDGVINLSYTRNPGAAFGILEGHTWFFILSTLVVLAAVIYYRIRGDLKGRPLMEMGVALLVGGAIGNAIDRVMHGLVTDFFEFQFVHFAIFNVADVAINIGVGLMALSILLDWYRTGRKATK